MRSVVLLLLLFLGFLPTSFAFQSGTRPIAPTSAEQQQQAVVIEQLKNSYSYNADGTGTHSTEARVKVLSQAGVQGFGQLVFGYNSESEQSTIDYVRVRKPTGAVVETDVKNAPEVSLVISQGAPVYTDYREKHISVSGLAAGDTLEYKTTTRIVTPLAKGNFWLAHSFEHTLETKDEELSVELPAGVNAHLKSPKHEYHSEENAGKELYVWKSSFTPEPEKKKNATAAADKDESADVQLSTFSDWKQVVAWYDALQRPRSAVDPTVAAKAKEVVAGATTDEQKARKLYDFVSRNIRYVSLSFGVGRYQPHSAAEVLQNAYGDCKDKHTLLASMLASVGIAAHPVLIHSSADLDPDLPSPAQFDHVITAASIGGKQVLLDTTPEVAPYGLILANLRHKEALLIDPTSEKALIDTPADPSVPSVQSTRVEGKFNEGGNFEADFEVTASGDAAVWLRTAGRSTPQPQWQQLVQNLSYVLGFGGEVSKVSFTNLDEPEQPVKLTYHYLRKGYFTPDNAQDLIAKNTLPLPPLVSTADLLPRMKKGDEYILGGPSEVHESVSLKFPKVSAELRPPLAVSVARDYGTYSSHYELKDGQLTASRDLVMKTRAVPVARERDVASFLTAAAQDHDQEISFKVTPGAIEAADADAESLNNAARAKLDAKDYAGARDMAQKATEKDPKSAYAWNTLGMAYIDLGEPVNAEKALRKQVEVNPYDEYAWNNLGRALRDEGGRDDEAIAAFRSRSRSRLSTNGRTRTLGYCSKNRRNTTTPLRSWKRHSRSLRMIVRS